MPTRIPPPNHSNVSMAQIFITSVAGKTCRSPSYRGSFHHPVTCHHQFTPGYSCQNALSSTSVFPHRTLPSSFPTPPNSLFPHPLALSKTLRDPRRCGADRVTGVQERGRVYMCEFMFFQTYWLSTVVDDGCASSLHQVKPAVTYPACLNDAIDARESGKARASTVTLEMMSHPLSRFGRSRTPNTYLLDSLCRLRRSQPCALQLTAYPPFHWHPCGVIQRCW